MSPIQEITVKKRDGNSEQLNLDKMHKMVEISCEGITGVSASQIEMNSHIQFYDGVSTKQIQEILIKSAADLISEETPNYQYAAARLLLFSLRKEVWKDITPPKLIDLIKLNISRGVYDDILDLYTEEEWTKIESFIKHERDLDFTYAGIQQVYDKYLVQNRKTKERYETPQFAYILISAVLFQTYKDRFGIDVCLDYIKKYYDAISQFKINLPTPIIAGVRTPTKQYASCVLIEVDDNMDSICASTTAVAKYISKRAGIGLDVSKIRGIDALIRGGEVKHTGMIPFLKLFQGAVGSCAQGGIRNGAATVHFPIWHWEIEDLIVLKNNKGSEDSRVRHLDYSVKMSKIFYERYIKNESITLFSPEDVPELTASFGSPEFDDLYIQAEKKRSIRKRVINARELINNLISERVETGRIYIANIDHMNEHSPFIGNVVKMSNLCVAGNTIVSIHHDDFGIKEIEIKDLQFYMNKFTNLQILSYDLNANEETFSKIEEFAQTSPSSEVLQIEENGLVLICTPEHKIYTKNRGYVMAKDLIETDVLLTSR